MTTSKISTPMNDPFYGQSGERYGEAPMMPTSGPAVTKLQHYYKWLMQFTSMAMGRFEWKNLPDTVSERYMENILLQTGNAVFFYKPEVKAFYCTRAQTVADLDQYGDYTEITSIGEGGWMYDIPEDQGVMIWDNEVRFNSWATFLTTFARQAAEAEWIMDIKTRQQTSTTIISGPEGSRDDLERLAAALEMGENYIAYETLEDAKQNVSAVGVITQFEPDKWNTHLTNIYNRFCADFGVEHLAVNKNAQMSVAEATISSDATARMREGYLKSRQRAVDEINDKWDLGIEVDWAQPQDDISLVEPIDNTSEEED